MLSSDTVNLAQVKHDWSKEIASTSKNSTTERLKQYNIKRGLEMTQVIIRLGQG